LGGNIEYLQFSGEDNLGVKNCLHLANHED
jgi:hypothetical protein